LDPLGVVALSWEFTRGPSGCQNFKYIRDKGSLASEYALQLTTCTSESSDLEAEEALTIVRVSVFLVVGRVSIEG